MTKGEEEVSLFQNTETRDFNAKLNKIFDKMVKRKRKITGEG